ncbi:MAG TPA: ABC transporter ATP-binding protein [bacterium]|nr:ABC transporter ATP-binding protein [bacterium]HPN67581.1 ABC transporter ATP-binding protein [bacterium]
MIELKDIRKVYGSGKSETVVLKGVNFKIEKGEFVAVIGPSGSGKSTLMNILGLLDQPTSGQYFLEGEDVSKLSEDKLADLRLNKIGFVFQSFNLLPRTTVLRNVELPLIYTNVPLGERQERAKKLLTQVDLPEDTFDNYSNEISGGQMQRVAIARALVNNPSIIFADEPTGNLDTKTGEYVLKIFQRLNEEQGNTIVMITHEADVASHAKRIIKIVDGNIVEDKAVENRIISK